MSINQILKTHPSLTAADDVRDLCQPLSHMGITYFGHGCIHPNGQITGISSHPEYFSLYLKKGFYNLDLHTESGINTLGCIHWDFLPQTKKNQDYYQAHHDFNLFHEFTMIKSDELNTHFYHFATTQDQVFMNQLYVQHMDLLEKFITYYHHQLEHDHSLNIAHQIPIPVKKVLSERNILAPTTQPTPQAITQFLADINCTNIITEANQEGLSHREKQCLMLLSRGNTAKGIGRILAISPKTVYFYLDNIKKKINCHSKNDLVEFYWQHCADS